MTLRSRAIAIAKALAERAGFHLARTRLPPIEVASEHALLRQIARAGPHFFFVQIGANDGRRFDNLYRVVARHRLRGVVVEPLADAFQQLAQNYAAFPQVRPVRAALHATEREVTLYRVKPDAVGVPEAAHGIASLSPEHYVGMPGLTPEAMTTEVVPAMTWNQLVAQERITRVDYLQIDTEGYDLEVLRMIDLAALRPAVLKFEHCVFRAHVARGTYGALVEQVVDLGYDLLIGNQDTVAYLP